MGASEKIGNPLPAERPNNGPQIAYPCRARRVIIAGGGTGGHLFPGIAIAEALQKRCPQSRILFVSSGRPLEESVLSKTGFEKAVITVEGIKGKTLLAKLRSVVRLPFGFAAALRLLIRFKPHLVIGMGGYSAGPVVMGAWMLRIPRVLHEQNRLPGMTNRILARYVNRIYTSFEDTRLKALPGKMYFTGNPVRAQILSALQGEKTGESTMRLQNRKFTVLILGGSQGAHSLNMSVVDALEYFKKPETYRFVHQTGTGDVDIVREAYLRKGMECVVAPFFENMAGLYREADLVVCRAGATTVSEVSIAGCAVIFVPFPQATDNHQVHNALGLVSAGAAEMIRQKDLTGEHLKDRIEFYAGHPDQVEAKKKAIQSFGMPDAAARIADDLCRLMGQGGSL